MEKIIDKILSDFRWTPTYFNDFCSENKLDKISRSAFKSSLESTIKELSSEKEQIENDLPPYKTVSEFIRFNDNFILDKREPVYGNVKKFNSKSDEEKYKSHFKRLNTVEQYLNKLKLMLQIVIMYGVKETTPTRENENNVPGLIQFDEPLKSKIEEINSLIFNSELGGVNPKTIKSEIKFYLKEFYNDKKRDNVFFIQFPNFVTFVRKVFPHLKFNFDWKLNSFVKTLQNKK